VLLGTAHPQLGDRQPWSKLATQLRSPPNSLQARASVRSRANQVWPPTTLGHRLGVYEP